MYSNNDVENLAKKCKESLDLSKTDPNYCFPKALPICLLEAVFSIAANNTSSKNTYTNYMNYFNIVSDEKSGTIKPEHTIKEFIENVERFKSIDEFTDIVLKNHQRTSSRNGILKSEAVYEIAKIFQKYKINTLADFQKCFGEHRCNLEKEILNIKGQSSGIMLKYLYMLAGNENTVKPDRMLMRFINSVNKDITIDDAQQIISECVTLLKRDNKNVTPRLVDYLIWDYQRLI